MRRHYLKLVYLIICVFIMTACSMPASDNVDREWQLIEDSARNTTVRLYAWEGNSEANEWFDGYLKKELMDTYGITLIRVPMSYQEIFQTLKADKMNEIDNGEMDLLWISGANFKYAYENEYLFGPYASKLPMYEQNLSAKNPEVQYDLFFPVRGYEVPFGKTQFTLFYNEDLLYEPPESFDDLMTFAKANPGMFTYPAPPDPDGSAFVRSVVYHFVNYKTLMTTQMNKMEMTKIMQPAIGYLKEMEPYLWREGTRYPSSGKELDKLFFDGEVVISMSYDHNHATDMLDGFNYPEGSKPLMLDTMVGRTHYLAIPYNSMNKSGAMIVMNHCLSAEAQASKFNVRTWGDIPVLERQLLSASDLRLLTKAVTKKTSPKLDDLLDHRASEVPVEMANLINEIWMEEIGAEAMNSEQ